jgi:hypothetical protein
MRKIREEKKKYSHLDLEEREKLHTLSAQGKSFRF